MTVRPELPNGAGRPTRLPRAARGRLVSGPACRVACAERYAVVATLRNAFAPNPCTSCWRRMTRWPCAIGGVGRAILERQRREGWGAKVSDRLVAEYALRGFIKPIRVADWETRVVDSPPDESQRSLPTVAK